MEMRTVVFRKIKKFCLNCTYEYSDVGDWNPSFCCSSCETQFMKPAETRFRGWLEGRARTQPIKID